MRGPTHCATVAANIKVRPDGMVKVLDFGLAKAFDSPSSSNADAMTLTSPVEMTQPGVIFGTAPYLSPEQARGQVVDKRTDIWAFGCVLYEMLAGRSAFRGNTLSDTIAAILGGKPTWEALPPAMPAGIRALLQRCLEKDPKRRLRDIGDARIELDHLDSQNGGVATTPGKVASVAAPAGRRWSPGYRAVRLQRAPAPARCKRGGAGASESLVPGMSISDYDISRDDKEVAFTTTDGGESTIWVAPLDRDRAPRLVARSGDQVSFGANGELILVIDSGATSPGPDPSTYVFTKTDSQRNLFRIPLS
jgi:Protein kinase domain